MGLIRYHCAVQIRLVLIAAALCAASVPSAAQTVPPPPLLPLTLEGDPARGTLLAETCAGCHGVPGYRNAYPSYHVPKLGGQNADYIEIALQGYRRGTREHPTMRAQAATLSDQDIADLAAYLSTYAGEPAVGKSGADQLAVEEGRRKAVACLQCHGETGVAQTTQWPHLAGQHESYLKQALREYKDGGRQDLLMGPLIAPLDDTTIDELAAYFAAQPWLHGTER
jgi:cytochrome c553